MLPKPLIAPPELPQPPLQVTIHEAARLLAYNTRIIHQLIARGELLPVCKSHLLSSSLYHPLRGW